ncbi:hypothetical protein [Salana multivorans]
MDLPPVPDLDESRWDALIAAAAASQPWEAAGELVPDPHSLLVLPADVDDVDLADDELADLSDDDLTDGEDPFAVGLDWTEPDATDDLAGHDDLTDHDDLAGHDGFDGLDGT